MLLKSLLNVVKDQYIKAGAWMMIYISLKLLPVHRQRVLQRRYQSDRHHLVSNHRLTYKPLRYRRDRSTA